MASIGALDAAFEPAGGLGGVIGWLTDAGEVIGLFSSVMQPFRDFAVTLLPAVAYFTTSWKISATGEWS